MFGGKIVRIPFESARDIPDDAQFHSLSARSQMLALSQTGFLHWHTRWYREDGAELSDSDNELIEDWASTTEAELMTPSGAVSEDVPTPYWDEDSEVDDSAPKDTQTWYGTIVDPTLASAELTFVENATRGACAFWRWRHGK